MKKKHGFPFPLYNALLCLLAVAAAAFLCLGVKAAEERWYLKWDVSDDQLSALSDYTISRLDALTQDVTLYPVYDASAPTDSLYDLQMETMRKMASVSPRIRVEPIDPVTRLPMLQSLAGETAGVPNGTVFVRNGEGTRTIRLERESFLFARKIMEEVYTIYCGEAMLIGGIDRACDDDPAAVWFLTGHGEYDESACGQLALQFRAMGFDVRSGQAAAISPRKGDVVMLLAPSSDLTQKEADRLASFLDEGGNLILALGAEESMAKLPMLRALCDLYGLDFLPGWVVENAEETARYVDHPEWLSPLVQDDTVFPDGLPGRLILPRACALQTPQFRPGVEGTVLLTTSDRAVRKTDVTADPRTAAPDDATGPAHLAVMAVSGDMHILQLASADMLLDGTAVSGAQVLDASANLDFLGGCMQVMTGGDPAATLDAGVKRLPNQLITFDSERTRQTVSILLLTVLPGSLAAAMALVMLKRRRM